MKPYHYKECGLDNVFIYNMKMIVDDKEESVIYIPKVNKLHKAITMSLMEKEGLLSSKEIRFVRTQLGMRQAEFSKMLGKEEQAAGRWERDECTHDKSTDILIRTMTISLLKFDMPIENISEQTSKNVSQDAKINIDGANENYVPMKIAA